MTDILTNSLLMLLVTVILSLTTVLTAPSVADTKKDLVQPSESHYKGIPRFLEQPAPVYYVSSKSTPVLVTCVAEPVSHVNIFCADKQYSYMNEAVSASGLRVTKLDEAGRRWRFSLPVKHKDVMEWFSEYRCYCEAWNQIEQLQRVKKVLSRTTVVQESYFNDDFKQAPRSQTLPQGESLKLTCIPPMAKPDAEIYWTKNGVRIGGDRKSGSKASSDKQTQVAESLSPGHIEINDFRQLVIANVKLGDTGNYSCVAESLGLTRVASAQVDVLELGKWEPWGVWDVECPAECYVKESCPELCGTLSRRRVRRCGPRRSRNIGSDGATKPTKCRGPEVDTQRCDNNCRTDLWTFWSEWSSCSGSLCQKSRQRQCTVPERCLEPVSLQIANCSSSECPGILVSSLDKPDMKSVSSSSSSSVADGNGFVSTHDVAMYVGLFVAVSVFLMVVMVIFCLIKRKVIGLSPNRAWRYSTNANGMPIFYPNKQLKKDFSSLTTKQLSLIDMSQQPSVYRSMILPNTSMPFLATNGLQQQHQQQASDTSSNAGYTDVGNELTYIQNPQMAGMTTLVNSPLLSSTMQPLPLPQVPPPPLLQQFGPQHMQQQQQQQQHHHSMMRPSYSDSRVGGSMATNCPSQPPPPPPPFHFMKRYVHCGQQPQHQQQHPHHQQLLSSSTLPAIATAASSHPDSDHYQELANDGGTTTDNESVQDQHQPPPHHLHDNNTRSQLLQRQAITDQLGSDNIAWARLDHRGVHMTLPFSDTVLICPANLITPGSSETVFLATSTNETDFPHLNDNETLLSPVVVCGPSNLVVPKPFILSIPHCANTRKTDWSITLLTSYSSMHQNPFWQKFVELNGNECAVTSNTSTGCYAQLSPDRLLLMTTQLQRYCVVGSMVAAGSSGSGSSGTSSSTKKQGGKMMRLLVYGSGLTDDRHTYGDGSSPVGTVVVVLHVYVVPDLRDSMVQIHKLETETQYRLISNQKQLLVQHEAGNVTVTLKELASDWQVCGTGTAYQELDLSSVWRTGSQCCSFSLSSSGGGFSSLPSSRQQSWSCSLAVRQQSSPASSCCTLLLSSGAPLAALTPPMAGSTCGASTSSSSTVGSSSTASSSSHNNNSCHTMPSFIDDCHQQQLQQHGLTPGTTGPRVTMSVLPYDCVSGLSPGGFCRLPETTRQSLCLLLDPPSPLDNDWRQLAQFLSVKRSLNFFTNNSNVSPTEILLDLWMAQSQSKRSLSTLMDFFRKIGRMDCVSVLEQELIHHPN